MYNQFMMHSQKNIKLPEKISNRFSTNLTTHYRRKNNIDWI